MSLPFYLLLGAKYLPVQCSSFTHLQVLQPLLQGLQRFPSLLRREGAPVRRALPVVGIRPVAAVGVMVVVAVVRGRAMMR